MVDRLLRTTESEIPNWHLVILGESPEREVLEIQLRTAGLESRVLLLGRVGNVGEWYERSSAYVMTPIRRVSPHARRGDGTRPASR